MATSMRGVLFIFVKDGDVLCDGFNGAFCLDVEIAQNSDSFSQSPCGGTISRRHQVTISYIDIKHYY